MKRIMIGTLLGSVAMTGAALAQAPGATASGQATQTEEVQSNPAAEPGVISGEAGTGVQQSEGGFYTYQEGSQMLGSGLMGADVWGAERERIGSVDDLLLDSEGQVMAVIIGVGGFLGIGEKDVAISTDRLEFVLAEDAAATAPAANAPAAGTAATDTAGTGGVAAQNPANAPAGGTAATASPAVPGGAATGTGATGAAGTGMTRGVGPGVAGNGMARQGSGWNWTGSGIHHIEVDYTREQLEAAPEFAAAD